MFLLGIADYGKLAAKGADMPGEGDINWANTATPTDELLDVDEGSAIVVPDDAPVRREDDDEDSDFTVDDHS